MATGFGYFVLKLRLDAGSEPQACAGTVERLGTAERRSFESAEELIRLLAELASDAPRTLPR